MWPFGHNRAESHESCKKRLEELEDRLGKVELRLTENTLEVLDKAEKVAERLKDRVRKRDQMPAETVTPTAAPVDDISQAIREGRYPVRRMIR